MTRLTSDDFLYKNAPLVEVIAEVHWELKTLQSHPQARIDPYFDLFRAQFVEQLKQPGFQNVEELLPKEVPVELLPHKPHIRLRRGSNEWPLFQIGPGLFTANIIPPYRGWNEFREHLGVGLRALTTSYPIADKTMRFARTELRYIDAFTDALGMENYATFLNSHLAIPQSLPEKLVEEFVDPRGVPEARIECSFPITKPKGSQGFFRIGPGKAGESNAAIMELVCRSYDQGDLQSPDELSEWFDAAHMAVRAWFDVIASDELKAKMGPKTEIGEVK